MTVVKYSASFTRNMGNYEFIKIDLGVEDSPRGTENTSAALERCKKFVDDRLLLEIETLEQQIIDARKAIKDRERERKIKQAAQLEE